MRLQATTISQASFVEQLTPHVRPQLAPPLKWAGGKRWLLSALEPLWETQQHRRLIEPFVGGMAVALGLRPESAILNDSNPHLINFYRWLQKGLIIETCMENDQELFYKHRARFNALIRDGQENTKEAAELFYYLNRTGYNGLCRFNSKGEFNVPFGKYKTINYVRDFHAYVAALAGWELKAGDFGCLQVDPEDFIYADPPYDVQFTTYSPGGFNWDDQVRLADWLSVHPGPVVTSNQATERVLRLYQERGFLCLILDAPRMISCNGDRTPAKEVLAIKGVFS